MGNGLVAYGQAKLDLKLAMFIRPPQQTVFHSQMQILLRSRSAVLVGKENGGNALRGGAHDEHGN